MTCHFFFFFFLLEGMKKMDENAVKREFLAACWKGGACTVVSNIYGGREMSVCVRPCCTSGSVCSTLTLVRVFGRKQGAPDGLLAAREGDD